MQSGKYCSPGNRQTQTHPSNCQTEKFASCSSPVVASFTLLHPTVAYQFYCCSQFLCYNTTNS
ncbi:unnamed protein product [Staurois parvus]|uniref:Uncharacterized protein n=1 Tax=Staurois parvus TaxID=386267 RepID=A0ABN9G0L0_9NEOB|nr:unnamed protein product [Staurois parvus]